ncbi:HAMP domain-containing histidine kinase [Luteolibacter sp. GHJ8]|uniref:histidine kinase n=1 Tax=Luteolibacter rhizosphaerae TaxID=2989719 RepID=A0ABT3GA86_9BACT|nr:HAMP domain-containing sensor histidine kinase [Luteolibacter rhizosphaerae]MCW1916750.1 HAMP domain-containing histidine kinase [Luteolibacter rhizosphaerae]
MRKASASESTTTLRRPWLLTGAMSLLVSIAVVAGAFMLGRQETRISQKPEGNRVEDFFRESNRRVAEMERLWEQALDEEATRLLDKGLGDPPDGSVIAGVVQRSLLTVTLNDPARSHLAAGGGSPRWMPVLDRYEKKEKGEWVLPEGRVLNGSGWIEMADRPPTWWHGNGRSVALLMVAPETAAQVVADDLKPRAEEAGIAGEAGALAFIGPHGSPWMSSGKIDQGIKPDEILRHVSRFGDWSLHRYYPVRVEMVYRLPVFVGSFALALLVLSGGLWVAAAQKKAFRLAEQRVSFVNQVSHELRTPLTNLLLNTDLALDALPVEDGKIRRRLGLIREETSRLSRIVDNVLAFARIERGKALLSPVRCDLREMLEELRENFAPLFERKSIVCDYNNEVSAGILADRDSLAQILSNLLSNIEKYAGEGAKARVALRARDGQLLVDVIDNGPGIPREARQRIFLPFERAGSRVDEGTSGTGLGLAISRDLAERMGGRLELLASERGASFRLVLPLHESPVA